MWHWGVRAMMKPLFTFLTCAALLSAGCSKTPPRVEAPGWNPRKLTDQLFTQADTDQDGHLTDEELKSVASVRSSLPRIDSDGDGKLSQDEVEARFRLYREMRVGVTEKQIQVIYRRQPLADARVKLVPEDFLGEVIQSAEGTTDMDGIVRPVTTGADLEGVQLGFYRVEVECESANLPDRFRSDSSLGIEISPISEGTDSYGPITLELK